MPALLPVSELFPESFPESLPPGCAVFPSDGFVSSGCAAVDSSLESAISSPALYAFPSLASTISTPDSSLKSSVYFVSSSLDAELIMNPTLFI